MAQLQGPKILLEGPSGTGKTYALAKLVEWANVHKIDVFILFTENGLETLLGYWLDKSNPIPDNLYYHVVMTKPLGLSKLMKAADDSGKLSYELMTRMVDNSRGGDNNAFYKILSSCNEFTDDRTGEKFGSVEDFKTDKIFVIDSLSELSNACFKMIVGSKPTASQPDFGVAQNNLINFLRLCTQGMSCTFVMTAHVDRQTDEITGGIKLMTKSIGKALAGEIPQLFSDVVLTVREGTNFYWDTAAANADVKTRNLPIQSKLTPDFGVIMDKWLQRSKE